MIAKTTGIVLRITPYSRTSQIVEWLLRGYGRTHMLVKGAQRPTSPHLGQYDLFYECEVLFYDRAPNRLSLLKECTPLAIPGRARTDWRSSACASYFCALISYVAPAGLLHDDLYELLSDALGAVDRRSGSIPLLGWFELTLLRVLGFGVVLRRCASCAGAIEAEADSDGFRASVARGGILCRPCAESDPTASPLRIGPGTLAVLRKWDQARRATDAPPIRLTAGQEAEIGALLGPFVAYHLDPDPAPRATAIQVLRSAPALYTLKRK